jgi:xylulose-5-phosphate/fructose-6-phosphate phosphoketolase
MAPNEVDDVSMPNPSPEPSRLPDSVLDCRVELNIQDMLSRDELYSVECFRRAGDYIAAG